MDQHRFFAAALAAAALFGGGAALSAEAAPETAARNQSSDRAAFDEDRAAILAMTGDFEVTFDFRETVALADGYELKAPKKSGAFESVRVVEDRGDFISLQHILVVGEGDEMRPIKHWRQDWRYEPASVLTYVGGAVWEKRAVDKKDRKGKWSQTVYQVDDAPRYGAVAAWTHENGVSAWASPAAWRPLPRRDATTRDDYHALAAANRHVITPFGWAHEQDNAKIALDGPARVLVHEVGVNTYRRSDDFDVAIADDYWAKTKDYWAGVRANWNEIEAANARFGLTVQGEAAEIYSKILALAFDAAGGETPVSAAVAEADAVIDRYTTTRPAPLNERIAATPKLAAAD